MNIKFCMVQLYSINERKIMYANVSKKNLQTVWSAEIKSDELNAA